MPMRPYFEFFPPGTPLETRSLFVRGAKGLPDGKYRFVEFYCDEPACDCRRVTVQVWDEEDYPRATISFGWESPDYYRKWSPGVDQKTAKEMASVTRELLGPQSSHATAFIAEFRKAVANPNYLASLQRHYAQVRSAVAKRAASLMKRRSAASPARAVIPAADASIYQLKITLRRSKPPIWRRVEVPGTISFEDLHTVIQITMGWEDSHLHSFQIAGRTFSARQSEGFGYGGDGDERALILSEVCSQPKVKFRYEYDFGDCWEHEILVEKIMPPGDGVLYPRCVAGKRACPPEDCGGIWGYANMLDALANPSHESHADMKDWIGDEWDAEAFNLKEVNECLAPFSRHLDKVRKASPAK